MGELFSCPSCRARIARSLPLSHLEPACNVELPAFQSKVPRACVRRALASLSTTALIFLQRGGANPAGRPSSSIAWSRALRAADSASRISSLSFDGDKQGRMRQSCEAVVFEVFMVSCIPQKSGSSTQHDFSVGTWFEIQNRFRDIGGSVICVAIGAKTSALEVVQALKRVPGRGMGAGCGVPAQPRLSYKKSELYQLASLSLPTHVTQLLADPTNLTPSVVHVIATALFARLPPQHRRPMSGKGSGCLCLSRHRALRAGAETDLPPGTVSAHFDLIS